MVHQMTQEGALCSVFMIIVGPCQLVVALLNVDSYRKCLLISMLAMHCYVSIYRDNS